MINVSYSTLYLKPSTFPFTNVQSPQHDKYFPRKREEQRVWVLIKISRNDIYRSFRGFSMELRGNWRAYRAVRRKAHRTGFFPESPNHLSSSHEPWKKINNSLPRWPCDFSKFGKRKKHHDCIFLCIFSRWTRIRQIFIEIQGANWLSRMRSAKKYNFHC